MERNGWLRALIVLGVLFLGVQLWSIVWEFARHFADIILIFVLAWLIAFLLNPAVQFFTITRKTPRILAVAAVTVLSVDSWRLRRPDYPPHRHADVDPRQPVPEYAADISSMVTGVANLVDKPRPSRADRIADQQ